MRFLVLCILIGLASSTHTFGTEESPGCAPYFDPRSPLLFQLTREGAEQLESVISDIQALQSIPITMGSIHSMHGRLLPLFVRSGLRWSEIVALATPNGYEDYSASCATYGRMSADLLSFLTYTLETNVLLRGGIGSRDIMVAFLRQFKAKLAP